VIGRRRTLRHQRDDARLQRDTMADQCDEALKAAETERFNVKRLAAQLSEARDERDALQQKLAAGRPTPGTELWHARRELMLERRIVAQLNDRLETLQAANEAMCREAVDRASAPTRAGVAR